MQDKKHHRTLCKFTLLISTCINQVYFWITSRQYSPFPLMSKSLIVQHLLTGHHNTQIHIVHAHFICTFQNNAHFINSQWPSLFLTRHFPEGHLSSHIIVSISPSFTGSSCLPSPRKLLFASPMPLPSTPGFS